MRTGLAGAAVLVTAAALTAEPAARRPTRLALFPDSLMTVSDDGRRRIWRISCTGPGRTIQE